MKKFLSVILAVCVLLCSCPVSLADQPAPCESLDKAMQKYITAYSNVYSIAVIGYMYPLAYSAAVPASWLNALRDNVDDFYFAESEILRFLSADVPAGASSAVINAAQAYVSANSAVNRSAIIADFEDCVLSIDDFTDILSKRIYTSVMCLSMVGLSEHSTEISNMLSLLSDLLPDDDFRRIIGHFPDLVSAYSEAMPIVLYRVYGIYDQMMAQ